MGDEDIMKGITLITKGRNTCKTLETQLKELLSDRVRIRAFYIDGGIHEPVADDLVIISSQTIAGEAKKYILPGIPIVIARRAINYKGLEKLLIIPEGTDVLLVNDLPNTTHETITMLNLLGMDHIRYHSFYPGIADYYRAKVAVTPGEVDLVPAEVEQIIDIGVRTIDLTTLVEILGKLGLLDEKANLLSICYINEIIALLKKVQSISESNKQIKRQLQAIINTVHDGIIALDKKGNITVFNPVAEEIFGTKSSKITEELLRKVIGDIETKNVGEEKFVRVRDKQLVVNCMPIHDNSEVMGIVYTLKDVTEIQRLEEKLRCRLREEEVYARYTFDDILGGSEAIRSAKELARRIAVSDSPILIQGESGTGKELFAQAIHNASPRRQGPFVAVNFAALPETLLESELFGYDEGAFTGAKKGGKAGLFEQAHGGTIFLDEIGDAPLSFQVRLLRVLQEKQVRRIGSSRVIPINIRVIAATNKNLKVLINRGEFREDLYYRINVLPLRIPPLRERKEDILELAYAFYRKAFNDLPPFPPEEFFRLIQRHLLNYHWPGNVRELANVVEYLVNVCSSNLPTPNILPEELRTDCIWNVESITGEILQVFTEIGKAHRRKERVGRRSLARRTGIPEGRVRKALTILAEKDLIKIQKGRRGIELSPRGHHLLEIFNTEMG